MSRPTLRLVRQYTYGEVECATCHTVQQFRSVQTRTGQETHSTTSDVRRYAYHTGWRQDTRGRYHCPRHTPDPAHRKPIPYDVWERHAEEFSLLPGDVNGPSYRQARGYEEESSDAPRLS